MLKLFVIQQDGKLPLVPEEKEMVLGVSKYGVKVASLDQCVSKKEKRIDAALQIKNKNVYFDQKCL